ncbi:disease resistance protein RUN1-like [Corylus avellana]|uniref:disease resistance protein RUN1-like n=1 Tax=Corylus avellana TaxID=13451 RepID=UPI002869FA12|nr:disease resistance protein RUN1-like [Corylus avellana]
MPDPIDDYQKLSIWAVEHAGGLPLALEVLGSYLLGKSVSQWKGELEELQRFPHEEIQKILRLSYESLKYPKQQIFLDIACFFIENGISVLIQRSLVAIDIKMKLRMHNLIRDMAREIVRKESSNHPGKRTRLWFHDDALNVLSKHTVLNKLKVLNLSYSKNLTKSPNFLRIPHLEMLILEGCINLVELHDSIGHLKHLVLLNLNECNNLRNLPRSISNLESLERLNFSGSRGRFPQSWLSSFSSWISPKSLLRASVSGIFYLGKLVLNNSNLSEDDIAIDLERLYSLQFLDLSYNNFCNLPYCISRLPKLKFLTLNHCMSLESISGLPVNVVSLLAFGCSSMERLSILPGSKISLLFLVDCCKLVEIQGFPLDSGGVFNLFGCYNLSSDFRTSLLKLPTTKHDCVRFTFLPGSEVPNWFTHQRIGSSISFNVPSISSDHVPSLSEDAVYILFICAVYAKEDESDRLIKISATVDNKSRGYRQVIVPATASYFANKSDHLFLVEWHLIRRDNALMLVSPGREMELLWKDEIEVSFDISSADLKTCVVNKCGVHLLVDEPTSNP